MHAARAIAGVLASRFDIQATTEELQANGREAKADRVITPEGPVAPGEHLLLVVQVLAQVKASAVTSGIQPGDLQSSAAEGVTHPDAPRWLSRISHRRCPAQFSARR